MQRKRKPEQSLQFPIWLDGLFSERLQQRKKELRQRVTVARKLFHQHSLHRNRHIWMLWTMGLTSQADLAHWCGISRARVHQIIARWDRQYRNRCARSYIEWGKNYTTRPLEPPEDAQYRDRWIDHDIT